MLGGAVPAVFYMASATAQMPGMPPPIPPGRKAVLYARAGIARSNAFRSNYIRPNITVLLEKYRYPDPPEVVDLTNWVRADTLAVTQAINDEPDNCSFTLKPELPSELVPEVGDTISVGLATEHSGNARRIAGGLEFAGPVITKQHQRRAKNESPWIALNCQDWQWFFDAQLVNDSWPAQSATITVQSLLDKYVNYSQLRTLDYTFTLGYVEADLPVCPAFVAINWRPTDVLRHLANQMAGGFYIDPLRRLHLWANGPEPYLSDPQPLENYRSTLKAFTHTVEGSQMRKRVVVEGTSATILVDIPALPSPYYGGIPVSTAQPFVHTDWRRARLGSQWVEVKVTHTLQASTENPFTAHVTADKDTTEGVLTVDAFPAFLGAVTVGWIKVGEQFIRYEQRSGNQFIVNVATYPFGKMIAPVKTNDSVTWVDWVDEIQGLAHYEGATLDSLRAAIANTPLVVLAEDRDTDVAQPWATALPPIEALVQDGRYGYTGASTRAADDVSFFKTTAFQAQWETFDYNSRPGRLQFINLKGADPVAKQVTIQTVDVTFDLRRLAPRRRCTGATVKPATLLDVMTTSQA
jgi:hypothetical protein